MKKLLVIIGFGVALTGTYSLQADVLISSDKKTSTANVGRDDCSKCEKAAEDAYKNSQRAEDSENFEDVRKYAREAVDSFDDAKQFAENCGCEKAEDEAGKGYKVAKKASKAENLQDAKEYAKEARKYADDLKSYAGNCSRN